MFTFLKEYSRLPLGTKTKYGEIAVCPVCGRNGAHSMSTREADRLWESWVHIERGQWLVRNEVHSCGRPGSNH